MVQSTFIAKLWLLCQALIFKNNYTRLIGIRNVPAWNHSESHYHVLVAVKVCVDVRLIFVPGGPLG